jgi:DNA invertase Pin-like site-specific DNA recombinase
MRRCAIYARYSSDLQRESSIEDQIRSCRERGIDAGSPCVFTAKKLRSGALSYGRSFMSDSGLVHT